MRLGLLYTVLNSGASFLLLIIVGAFSGLEVYGTFILIKAIGSVFAGIASFGISDTIIRFMNELELRNKTDQTFFLVICLIIVDLVLSVSIFLLLFFSEPILQRYFFSELDVSKELMVFALGVSLTNMRSTCIGVNHFRGQFNYFYGVLIAETLLILGAVAVVGRFSDLTVLSIVSIHLCVYAFCTFLMNAPVFGYLYKLKARETVEQKMLIEVLRFSTKNFVATLLKSVNQRIDYLILGLLLSKSDLAFFDAIKKVATLPRSFLQPYITTNNREIISEFALNGATSARSMIIRKSAFVTFFGFVAASFAALFLGTLLEFVFPEAQVSASLKLQLLTFFVSISLLFTWWVKSYSSGTNPVYSIHANLLYLVVSTPTLYLLSVIIGLDGALLAIGLVNSVLMFYWIIRLNVSCSA